MNEQRAIALTEVLELSAEERRRQPRRAINGTAMAVFNSGIGAGVLTRVKLVDQSPGGLGVYSPVRVHAGSTFSIVPEQGVGLRQVGLVAHCEPDGEGFRLGLRTKINRQAAA